MSIRGDEIANHRRALGQAKAILAYARTKKGRKQALRNVNELMLPINHQVARAQQPVHWSEYWKGPRRVF